MSSSAGPRTAATRPRRPDPRVIVVLVIAALTYTPILGPPLSVAVLVLTAVWRVRLWPGSSRLVGLLCSFLAWVGLWWPALAHVLLGWSFGLSSEVSTSWLVLPLCGPLGAGTVLVPAAAATALLALGLAVSHLRRQPWLWVLAAWLAPWTHHLALSALPGHEFVC
jgi:hypothetical protein